MVKAKNICLILLVLVVLFSIGDRYFSHPWDCEQLFLEQAHSFLQGQLAINVHDMDTATFNNKYFVPYPPTPALLFLPAVAAFGTHPLIPYAICFAAFVFIGFLMFRISLRLGLKNETAYYLSGALLLGTGLWMCLQYSFSATYNSHIFSNLFILAALHEVLVKKRTWLIGVFLSAACTSRPFAIVSGLFVLALLWSDRKKTLAEKSQDLLFMGLGALPLLALAMSFNYLRFNDIFNVGYSYISNPQALPTTLFDLRFIPRNLYTIFLRGPNMDVLFEPYSVSSAVDFKYNILGSDKGTSLTFASPFLLYAFFASWQERTVKIGWLTIILTLLPILCYAAIGMFQLNCARYAIDALPVFFVLTAMGLKKRPQGQTFKFLVGYSVFLNLLFLTPFLAMIVQEYIKLLMSFRT